MTEEEKSNLLFAQKQQLIKMVLGGLTIIVALVLIALETVLGYGTEVRLTLIGTVVTGLGIGGHGALKYQPKGEGQ